jgi:MFS family permease
MPLAELLRKYWKQVLLGALATISTGTAFNILVAFGLTYGKTKLGFSTNDMLLAVLAACAVGIVMLPLFGKLSDKFGRKPIIVGGIVAEIVVAFPLFWLMDTRSLAGVVFGYILLMTAFCANYGPIATFLAELFGSRVRYSGLSVAYMLAGLLGSAITPVVTTALLNATGQGSSVAWFMIGSAAVSLVALLLLTETLRSNIDAIHEAPSEAADRDEIATRA